MTEPSVGMYYKAGMDLVAAFLVGAFIGYGVDHFCGTKPWGMIGMILLGAMSGFRVVYKTVTQSSSGERKEDNVEEEK